MDPRKLMELVNVIKNVQLQEKKKLDPVDKDELDDKYKDREDKDIDNDGDEDESDEYLHKRRKAISKKMKGKEVENNPKMDEMTLPQSMKDRFTASDLKFLASHGVDLMGSNSGIDGAKAAADTAQAISASGKKGPMRPADQKTTNEALESFAQQLDELSTKTLKSYKKKAEKQADKAADSYSAAAMKRPDFANDTPRMAKLGKTFKKRDDGAYLAGKKLAKRGEE